MSPRVSTCSAVSSDLSPVRQSSNRFLPAIRLSSPHGQRVCHGCRSDRQEGEGSRLFLPTVAVRRRAAGAVASAPSIQHPTCFGEWKVSLVFLAFDSPRSARTSPQPQAAAQRHASFSQFTKEGWCLTKSTSFDPTTVLGPPKQSPR